MLLLRPIFWHIPCFYISRVTAPKFRGNKFIKNREFCIVVFLSDVAGKMS